MTAYMDRLLSIYELSNYVNVKYVRILEWSKMPDFPGIVYGSQVRVWLSDFRVWTLKHYGPNGDMRGCDITDVKIDRCGNRK